jgi:hypothetical protein
VSHIDDFRILISNFIKHLDNIISKKNTSCEQYTQHNIVDTLKLQNLSDTVFGVNQIGVELLV